MEREGDGTFNRRFLKKIFRNRAALVGRDHWAHRLTSLSLPPTLSGESRNQAARFWGLLLWGRPDRGHGPYKTGNNTYIYILYTETQSCGGRRRGSHWPQKPEAPCGPAHLAPPPPSAGVEEVKCMGRVAETASSFTTGVGTHLGTGGGWGEKY